jgi:ribosome-associated protein
LEGVRFVLLELNLFPGKFFKGVLMTMREVRINREPVELYKILKFENLVMSGGEAKHVIAQGMVSLNGEVETRKRKKIFSGDIVEFSNERLKIVL